MRRWPPHRADWAFGEDRPSQLWFQRGIQALSINRSCFLFLADILVARFHRFNWPQRGKNRNLQNLLVLTAIKADKPSSQPVMRGSGYLMICLQQVTHEFRRWTPFQMRFDRLKHLSSQEQQVQIQRYLLYYFPFPWLTQNPHAE